MKTMRSSSRSTGTSPTSGSPTLDLDAPCFEDRFADSPACSTSHRTGRSCAPPAWQTRRRVGTTGRDCSTPSLTRNSSRNGTRNAKRMDRPGSRSKSRIRYLPRRKRSTCVSRRSKYRRSNEQCSLVSQRSRTVTRDNRLPSLMAT
jgi:hypothetical protein